MNWRKWGRIPILHGAGTFACASSQNLRGATGGGITVLREILGVLQDDPSSQRRWFHDDYFDLFVRQTAGELAAFELCYGVDSSERALAWSAGRGYFHDGGPLEADPIVARFERVADGLPEVLRLALGARLREYAQHKAPVPARRARFRRADWQQTGGEQNPEDQSRIS